MSVDVDIGQLKIVGRKTDGDSKLPTLEIKELNFVWLSIRKSCVSRKRGFLSDY